jgi:hypothetical protein
MGVGDANSRLCGMMVAGVEVEVASRRGGGRVTNRSITPRPASCEQPRPASGAGRRNDRVRDIDIRFAISTA